MTDMLLADQAFGALKGLLFDGAVRAGQMVSIAELVERSGFPLAPVREAVKRAEVVGLVQILPKRGVLVIEPTPDTIQACFHLRCLMDQEGARVLAARAGRDGLDALRDEHAEVRLQAGRGITPELQRRAMEVDWKLHLAMAGALGNCYDRLVLGHVRDFVHFHVDPIGFDCAIFNFADNMLVAGAITLMLLALRPEPTPAASSGLETSMSSASHSPS